MVQVTADQPGEHRGHKWTRAGEVVDVPEHDVIGILSLPGFKLTAQLSATDLVPKPVRGEPKRTLIHEVDDAESGEEIEQT